MPYAPSGSNRKKTDIVIFRLMALFCGPTDGYERFGGKVPFTLKKEAVL
jgi:hypothetical protein